MDLTGSNNKEELTSIATTMGNLLSTTNEEEKIGASDSVPTSSTDAFTNASTSQIALDDPISSTSSDVVEPKKLSSKSTMNPAISSGHNFSSPIASEKDLLDMKITDTATEQITENVDDLVQDLENLLGESSTTSSDFSTKTPSSTKASTTTYASDQLEIRKSERRTAEESKVLKCEPEQEEESKIEKCEPQQKVEAPTTLAVTTNDEIHKDYIENTDKKDVVLDSNLPISDAIPETVNVITEFGAESIVNVESHIEDIDSDNLNTQDASKTDNDINQGEVIVATEDKLAEIGGSAPDHTDMVKTEVAVHLVETVDNENETHVQLTDDQMIVQEAKPNAAEEILSVVDYSLEEKETDLVQDLKEEAIVENLEIEEIKNEDCEIPKEPVAAPLNTEGTSNLHLEENVQHIETAEIDSATLKIPNKSETVMETKEEVSTIQLEHCETVSVIPKSERQTGISPISDLTQQSVLEEFLVIKESENESLAIKEIKLEANAPVIEKDQVFESKECTEAEEVNTINKNAECFKSETEITQSNENSASKFLQRDVTDDKKIEVFDTELETSSQTQLDTASVPTADIEMTHKTDYVGSPPSQKSFDENNEDLPSESSTSDYNLPEDSSGLETISQTDIIKDETTCADVEAMEVNVLSPNANSSLTGEWSKDAVSSEQSVVLDNASNIKLETGSKVVDTTLLNLQKDQAHESLLSIDLAFSEAGTSGDVDNVDLKIESVYHSSTSDVKVQVDTQCELAVNSVIDEATPEAFKTITDKSETKESMLNSDDQVLDGPSNLVDSLAIGKASETIDLDKIEAANSFSIEVVTDSIKSQCEIATEPSNDLVENIGSSDETLFETCDPNIAKVSNDSSSELCTDTVKCSHETENEVSCLVDLNAIDKVDVIQKYDLSTTASVAGTIQSQKETLNESLKPQVDSNVIDLEETTQKFEITAKKASEDSSVEIVIDNIQSPLEIEKEHSNAADSRKLNTGSGSMLEMILETENITKLGVEQAESYEVAPMGDTSSIDMELVNIDRIDAKSLPKTSDHHTLDQDNVSELSLGSNVGTTDLPEDFSSKDVSTLDQNNEVVPIIIDADSESTSISIKLSESVQVLDNDIFEQVEDNFRLNLSENSNESSNAEVIDDSPGAVPIMLDDAATISDNVNVPRLEGTCISQVTQSPDSVAIFEEETVADPMQSSGITAGQMEPSVSNSQFKIVPEVIQSSDITDSLNIDSSNINEDAQEPVSCSNREDSPEVEVEAGESNIVETVSCSERSKNKLTFTKEQITNDENLETLLAVASLSSSYQASFEEFMFEKQNYEALNEVGVTEKGQDVSSTVVDEKIDDSKLKEPLLINIDDNNKDRISDSKIIVKPLKSTEEDNDEREGSKGTLKMTITKQSDTMHSILKIYQPGDSTTEENEQNITTEQVVPKLIIKPVMPLNEQLESPKSSSKLKHVASSSGNSPRITIKPIIKPESVVESLSPLKITIKPVLKPEDTIRQKSSPKLTIKPILKPDEEPSTESRVHSPRITIKPIIKPPDECDITPRITIKPIVEPPAPVTPKITIKPVLKPQDTPEPSFSPKITIKPIIKPSESSSVFTIDESNEDSTAKERIVLKINKGNLPTTSTTLAQSSLMPTTVGKDVKKREIPVEKIKLKFSKEGGHPHIVQNDFPNKRLKTDDESANITVTPTHSRIRELLTSGRTDYSPVRLTEDFDEAVKIVQITENKSSPIVISEESTQDTILNLGLDLNDPLSEIPVFAITPDSVKTLNAPTAVKPTASSQEASPIPPAPRKRGRPRKVPLQVREDFKDPKDEEKKPIVIESTRPKRSCRGPSVRMTLGIKPRKPRGPGRGRGSKRGMGTRNITASRDSSPIPAKEPKLSLKQQLKEANQHTLLIGDKIEAVRSGIEIDDGFYKSPISSNSQLMPPQSDNSTSDRADIVMYEEDTRMSAEISSRAQTPAKQVITSTPSADIVEESQSSVQSTATTESAKARKGPRLEVHQEPEGAVISADQLAEYYWSGGGPYMLQEQVAQFLGIKSFKRKYPNIPRRIVDMQERDFIRESGLAGEAMCDLGLTSVNSADILDIMYSDFQDKYEEYCKHQRDRQAKDLINKQKALSLAAMQEKTKLDITQQAVQSASTWNTTFNKARREQRKACMDLQTLTVHYPKGKVKQINRPKIGSYPIALVPGQFTDYFGEFTPTELNNLPFNTMCYNPIIRARDLECDSQTDGSGSDSDTSSSGTDSSYSSSDAEDCTLCKPPPRKIVAAVQ